MPIPQTIFRKHRHLFDTSLKQSIKISIPPLLQPPHPLQAMLGGSVSPCTPAKRSTPGAACRVAPSDGDTKKKKTTSLVTSGVSVSAQHPDPCSNAGGHLAHWMERCIGQRIAGVVGGRHGATCHWLRHRAVRVNNAAIPQAY